MTKSFQGMIYFEEGYDVWGTCLTGIPPWSELNQQIPMDCTLSSGSCEALDCYFCPGGDECADPFNTTDAMIMTCPNNTKCAVSAIGTRSSSSFRVSASLVWILEETRVQTSAQSHNKHEGYNLLPCKVESPDVGHRTSNFIWLSNSVIYSLFTEKLQIWLRYL